MVRCKVCSEIEGQEKLLVLKLDNLQKTCRKAKVQSSMSWMCCGAVFNVNRQQTC